MLISYSNRFIFFHVAKVAGLSIRQALSAYLQEPEHFKIQRPAPTLQGKPNPLYEMWSSALTHATAQAVKRDMGREYDDYYSFAFVRNPWDWQVSMYHFLLKEKNNPRYELISNMSGFEEYVHWVVQEKRPYPKAATKLQTDMLLDENGKLIVDFIGRFENLSNDFKQLCQQLGIQASLPLVNSSKHLDYQHYYNPALIKLVANAFQQDIALLGYTFNSFSTQIPLRSAA